MSKLTVLQKQQLKDLVIDATVKRLTNLEMVNYIQYKMQITISQDYLKHVKSSIRKDTKNNFDELRKDRYLFLDSIFFDRVEELRYMQKVLHEVIETNADNGDIQIKAVAQLQSITNQLERYYTALPKVAKVGVMDFDTLFPSTSDNSSVNNNSNAYDINNNINNDDRHCYLAIALIDGMKRLFAGKGLVSFDTKETVIELNNVKIEAFPSHHLDAMRGLRNVSFILLDEADFFPPGQQQDARDVSERYIAKSNPYIVMVSTPNAPDGLFERIEKEPEDTCLYKRIFLDHTYGIGKIYTAEEIEKAKQSPSFEREYKYLGKIGNVFHTKDIEAAIEKGRKYNPDTAFNPIYRTSKSMGIDPAYGRLLILIDHQ